MTRQEWATKLLATYPVAQFIDHELYRSDGIENVVFGPVPGIDLLRTKKMSGKSEMAGFLNVICSHPILTREQEVFLFQRLNYCRYRANVVRCKLSSGDYTENDCREFALLQWTITETRNTLLSYNMRLVVNYLLKKGDQFTIMPRLGDASLVAMNAIDKFDWSRGSKLSTYMSWAFIKSCHPWKEENPINVIKGPRTVKHPFTMVEGLALDEFVHGREERDERVDEKEAIHTCLKKLAKSGFRRHAEILYMRYNLDGENTVTLAQIGSRIGVTRERVRQLCATGMKELRKLVRCHYPHLELAE